MNKTIKWEKLKITQSELDDILDLDLFSSWAIDLNRILIQHKRQYIKSFLITEVSVLFLGIILFFPLTLIILRNLRILANNTGGFLLLLGISLLFSTIGLLILNYYLWLKAKKLKSLATILEKIKQYNQLINNLQLVNKINYLNYSVNNKTQVNFEQLSQIEAALNLTKVSLLKSIDLEKIVNLNQKNISDRDQLFTNLEDDLVQFLSFDKDSHHSEYQQLLTEVVQIGLSVHQEVRKIQTLNKF